MGIVEIWRLEGKRDDVMRILHYDSHLLWWAKTEEELGRYLDWGKSEDLIAEEEIEWKGQRFMMLCLDEIRTSKGGNSPFPWENQRKSRHSFVPRAQFIIDHLSDWEREMRKKRVQKENHTKNEMKKDRSRLVQRNHTVAILNLAFADIGSAGKGVEVRNGCLF